MEEPEDREGRCQASSGHAMAMFLIAAEESHRLERDWGYQHFVLREERAYDGLLTVNGGQGRGCPFLQWDSH